MKQNKFFNKKVFCLIEVQFNRYENRPYTYVAHVKQNVKVGDWIIVPIGSPVNVFSDGVGNVQGVAYDHTKVVRVSAIKPVRKIEEFNYELKPIVSVIDHNIYDKITAARDKLTK